MTQSSADLLEKFRLDHARDHKGDINLTLRPVYFELLNKLGNPHQKLPPVFHVAGTNGKGSTCAFLRSILEAAGYKVHVYTSPHLINFHERIRIAGKLIDENELVEILSECAKGMVAGTISYFEASTATALAAFARHSADFTILETGLGGRLDATNVVEKPLATLITRLSYDHREYLGETLTEIAREKAGIMRKDVPCFVSHQPNPEGLNALREAAKKINTKLFVGGETWRVEANNNGFRFHDDKRAMELPTPSLLGEHQFGNAGLAIAALSVLPKSISQDIIADGIQKAEWPARLQQLKQGTWTRLLPENWELWLDGGHNDSAGEVLATQAAKWKKQDNKPLYLIMGMLTTKKPEEFLAHLKPYIAALRTLPIANEPLSFSAEDLANIVEKFGVQKTRSAISLQNAITDITQSFSPGRILICGSLYLAGNVLRENNS